MTAVKMRRRVDLHKYCYSQYFSSSPPSTLSALNPLKEGGKETKDKYSSNIKLRKI